MTTTLEAPVTVHTVTVSDFRLKPGIGYVLFRRDEEIFQSADEASAFYTDRASFWLEGSELREMDSNTVEIQVGGWRRMMVELS